MFNRLVSNLPFNPSLIGQVAFYAKRLRQETVVRRLGFVFMALTFVVQMFAVIAPPQPSLAQDVNNDLIPGGFVRQEDAVNHCRNNDFNFRIILEHFGVDCDTVARGTVVTISSRSHDGKLFSMGRLPYGKPGEYAEEVPGAGTFYLRPLSSWDGASATNYKVISGKRRDGSIFKILFNCGNLTIIKTSTPPPPPPPVKSIACSSLTLSVSSGTKVKKGTTITARGKAKGSNLPAGELVDFWYDYIDAATGKPVAGPELSAQGVPFKSGVATDPNSRSYKLDKPGHYVFRLAVKYDGSSKDATGNLAGSCARDVFVEQPPADVCPKKSGVQTDREECDVCPIIPGTQETEAECKPCDKSPNNDTTACLALTKTASNNTQNIAKADGTTARAGDVITYTLSVTNTGKVAVKSFAVQENISDILDYADVADLHGGSLGENNIARWPAATIDAGATLSKQLTIKIKNPIPATPVSASNPGKFDLTMTNVYGNVVNIKLPSGVVKSTEQITTTALPNTGPGLNIFIAVTLVTVVGYFFARSRLLTKELDIIRVEYATGA